MQENHGQEELFSTHAHSESRSEQRIQLKISPRNGIVEFVRLAIVVTAVLVLLSGPVSAESKPNIILILADDLGYGGLSCCSDPGYRTPHLDRLAKAGARFTQFYVPTPGCAPTRAALLTGRYPFRSGMIRNPDPDHGLNDLGIPSGEILLSEALQAAGYATACVGKWHLGHRTKFLPTRNGFDEYYGILCSNSSRPAMLVENEQVVEHPVVQAQITRKYTARALRFIEQNAKRPFFLYLAHSMPHYPLAASDDFYTPDTPDDLYADVIREMDHSTGVILNRLGELNLNRNTMVIFTSDNGPWYGGHTGGLRGMKGSTFEGGIRVPMILRWPGVIPAGRRFDAPASVVDLFPTLLAAVGAAVPAGHVIDGEDLLPSLKGNSEPPARPIYSTAGARVATVRMGRWKYHAIRPGFPRWTDNSFRPFKPDGVTIIAPKEQYPGTAFPGPLDGDPPRPGMLFDLQRDPAEKRNVASANPKVVSRLKRKIEQMATQVPEDLKMPQAGPFRRVLGPGRVTAENPLLLDKVSFEGGRPSAMK